MKVLTKSAVTKYLTPLALIAFLAGIPASVAFADSTNITRSQNVTQRMDLNKVTVEELATLPGIGKKKAESIIQYREDKGGFFEVAQLTEVKGIGPKLLAKIEDKLKVSQ